MKWVTRGKPKIDRIACPWSIARSIDAMPEFPYVPASMATWTAAETGAIPRDVPGAELSHEGERCSFDPFLKKHDLTDPASTPTAVIVPGAGTAGLELAPRSAGLYAISLGLSRNFSEGHEMRTRGMMVNDGLCAWCRRRRGQNCDWRPVTAP